jgi:hypothetical protein
MNESIFGVIITLIVVKVFWNDRYPLRYNIAPALCIIAVMVAFDFLKMPSIPGFDFYIRSASASIAKQELSFDFLLNNKPITGNCAEVEGKRNKADCYADSHGIDKYLFRSLITKESVWIENISSPKGASGLTQLMPATASGECGLEQEYIFDIDKNLDCGASYLAKLLKMFGSVDLALAAYNAGQGNVRKYQNTIPPFKETRAYVANITSDFRQYQKSELVIKGGRYGQAVEGGDSHEAIWILAGMIQKADVDSSFIRFTSLNDAWHKNKKPESLHTDGLALDFIISEHDKSANYASKINGWLLSAGMKDKDFDVIDEYKQSSKGSTGGHIHVEFNTVNAANKFASFIKSQQVYADIEPLIKTGEV